MSGACAVFVKTPGLSPVKTRLAKAIGAPAARVFYEQSCNAVQDVVTSFAEASGFVPYWAVAEAHGASHWSAWPIINQGEGDLGDRLAHVYATLHSTHDAVMLLGADAPQVSATRLLDATRRLEQADYVVGPAADGGFYLFLSRQPIRAADWSAVTYSRADTLRQLRQALPPGRWYELPQLTDVDEESDLRTLAGELRSMPSLTLGQRSVLELIVELTKTSRLRP